MAARVVNFLKDSLSQLLNEDVKLIAGAEDEFLYLSDQVGMLYDSLDDVTEMENGNQNHKNLDTDIHSIIYKTEDVIDKFLVQEKNTVFRINRFNPNHKNRVQNLSEKINSIITRMDRLTSGSRNRQRPNAKRLLTENFRHHIAPTQELQVLELDEEVVGLDEEAQRVIRRLLDGSEDREVIPIVGMLGIGKTTLAIKICTDMAVTYYFIRVIRINVGQPYNMKDILLKILSYFKERVGEDQGEDENVLIRLIRGFVKREGRCLIVLDDVWETQVVRSVLNVLPKHREFCRIMVITQDISVARCVNDNPHCMKYLTDDESFELLKRRVFSGRSCPDDLVVLGKSIAGKCSGVPLAVVAIAGALRRCSKKSDWLRIEKNVEQHLMNRDDPLSCLKFVKTSYNQLSEEIQACFLYFGAFPQGFDIPAWKLIRLWIAEGLIEPPNRSQTLEETAKNYLNHLVNRNLVTVTKKTSDGNVKTCRVQGMLHNFCKEEASRKCLYQEVCPTADQAIVTIQDPVTSRRLCIQSSFLNDFLSTKPFAEHVRSFYCFSSETTKLELSDNVIKLIPKAFPLIRVLDIESVKFLFCKDFNQLFLLRYIAITGGFKDLPKRFGKFLNLQTLILKSSTSESTLDIKANIWSMLRLRHLHTNVPAKLPPPPTPTGKASCLQTLSVVSPESCTKAVLAKACNLKKLSIRGGMMTFLGNSNGGWCNLEELKCLEHLKLFNDVFYMNKSIHIPPFFNFLVTLTKLTLVNTRFNWDEASILGQFECLEVLKLIDNAFIGESWRLDVGGFSHLQVLWIARAELRIWEASKLHFPRLKYLVLESCKNLEAVPYELADVPSLEEMKLENTCRKAVDSAREIERVKKVNIKFKLTIFPPDADY